MQYSFPVKLMGHFHVDTTEQLGCS